MSEIVRLFKRRRHLIKLKEKLLAQDYQLRQDNLKRTRPGELAIELRGSTDKDMQALLANLESYAQYKGLINHLWAQTMANINKVETGKTTDFWNINKKLES